MYKRALFSIAISLLLFVAFSCDDSGTGPDNPESGDDPVVVEPIDSAYYADFIHIDTSGYVLIKSSPVTPSYTHEPYLTWEEVIGEPFIDVNNNGVYDAGIDIFIMSVGDDNMDLNHDGRYNGPDDPWEPGMPFDDIDGNGDLRRDEWYDKNYGPNTPYVDFNGNGVWDGEGTLGRTLATCGIWATTPTGYTWLYPLADSTYYYDSDSGFNYVPITVNAFCYVCQSSAEVYGRFETSANGLNYYFRSDKRFHLLDTGVIYDDTGRVDVVELFWSDYSSTCFREISVGESLSVDGITYNDLLRVRCDQIVSDLNLINVTHEGAFWEFYFSQQIGLFAVHLMPYKDDVERWYYFEPRSDTLPMLMTK